MKYLPLYFVLIMIIFCSCDSGSCGWRVTTGTGWRESYIFCDSINMQSTKEVDVWIDGKSHKVFAEEITVAHINCKP